MYSQTRSEKSYLSPARRVLSLAALAVALWIVMPPARAAAQGPEWQDHYPVTNTITASPMTTVSITYDQPMIATSVTRRTFAVHGMQSGLVMETHGVINDDTIIVTPTNEFFTGELVYAIATTQTTNLTGTHPVTPTQWQFTAGPVLSRCVAGFTDIGAGLHGVMKVQWPGGTMTTTATWTSC